MTDVLMAVLLGGLLQGGRGWGWVGARYLLHSPRILQIYLKQDCIPVGCVPSAAVAVSQGRCLLLVPGVSAFGPGEGCLLLVQGVSAFGLGGVCLWSRGVFLLLVLGVFPSMHWGNPPPVCRAINDKGMVFRYTWVYSKEDTMAHTRRPMVIS